MTAPAMPRLHGENTRQRSHQVGYFTAADLGLTVPVAEVSDEPVDTGVFDMGGYTMLVVVLTVIAPPAGLSHSVQLRPHDPHTLAPIVLFTPVVLAGIGGPGGAGTFDVHFFYEGGTASGTAAPCWFNSLRMTPDNDGTLSNVRLWLQHH